jgi:hypothetical protein
VCWSTIIWFLSVSQTSYILSETCSVSKVGEKRDRRIAEKSVWSVRLIVKQTLPSRLAAVTIQISRTITIPTFVSIHCQPPQTRHSSKPSKLEHQRPDHELYHHECGPKIIADHEVSTRVQSESRHDQDQYPRHQEVSHSLLCFEYVPTSCGYHILIVLKLGSW